jgi:hypothetical protein
MNTLSIIALKVLRKLYALSLGKDAHLKAQCEQNPDKAAAIICEALKSENPCMIARFGANELNCLVNYLGVKKNKKDFISYIKGNSPPWWWEKRIIHYLHFGAGFFPTDQQSVEKYKLIFSDHGCQTNHILRKRQ